MSSFLVTIFTACALIAEPEAFTTFKSTLYGFSFDYPASWVKEPVALCGHEWKENPKEVRDRKLWPVIYLYPERRGEEGQLRPAIHVRYQAIRTEGEYAPL